MIGRLYHRVFQVRKAAVLAASCLFAAVLVLMVTSTRTFRINQEAQTRLLQEQSRQLVILSDRVATLQAANSGLTEDAEKAKAQANTSVDQLVKEGIPPIVAAPEILDVPTGTATTAAPPKPAPPVVIPQPAPQVTEPPPTQPPPTDPPPTDPPPTDPPPTEPPPTEPPPTSAVETTTTITEET